jgi:hypothetical protein
MGHHLCVTLEELPAHDELSVTAEIKSLWSRLLLFGVLLAGVTIDLAFLVGWVFVIKLVDYLFERIIRPEGAGKVLRIVVESMFDLSTLAVLGTYIVRDLKRVIVRLWRHQ